MNIKIIPIGTRFGKLTVISHPITNPGTANHYKCRCDCGTIKTVEGSKMRCGTKSCGCINRQIHKIRLTKHGLYHHPLHGAWSGMLRRCRCKKDAAFKNYGGRGIKVLKDWECSFQEFFDWSMKNGYKEGLQIDRINNDGNYEPTNCRFVDRWTNARNRRSNKLFEFNGQTKCLAEWCAIFEVPYKRVHQRIKKLGWSFEDAMFKKKMKSRSSFA